MRTLVVTLTTVLTATCASQPQAKPVAIDPSNPAAAEAPRSHVSELSRPAAAEAAPSQAPSSGGHDHGGAGAPSKEKVVYTCPMHPEVVSDKPGRCPKCGMNLEKKADAAPDPSKRK
jgi:hypothetical protein